MTTICHFPFWFQWKHLFRQPKLWNFHLVDSKCFQIKFITNMFFFTGRCHFQLSNMRITKRFWLAGDDDYLRGATSINHQVALHANFKMYSWSAKGGEKGDPNRNPWLAKMPATWLLIKTLMWDTINIFQKTGRCFLRILRFPPPIKLTATRYM